MRSAVVRTYEPRHFLCCFTFISNSFETSLVSSLLAVSLSLSLSLILCEIAFIVLSSQWLQNV
jgi:hypothetical protein